MQKHLRELFQRVILKERLFWTFPEVKQLLDGAMVTCYQEKGITHDNLSLTDPEHPGKYKKMPILGDLHEVLMRKEECRRISF